MEGTLGIEPRLTESKSVVLPLYDAPLKTGSGCGNRTHLAVD